MVDRVPHPAFNGVTRYMRELAARAADTPPDLDLAVLHWGRCISPRTWLRMSRPGMRLPRRLVEFNKQKLFPFGVRRSGAALLHFPAHGIPPEWLQTGKPNLISLHGAAAQVAPEWDTDPERFLKLRRTVATACETNTHFVTFSRFARQEIIDHYGIDAERIDVIPHGVDHSQFRPQSAAERTAFRERTGLKAPFALYLGPCAPRKNVETTIRAFALARERFGFDHHLLLAGRRHAHQQRLEALVKEEGLADFVHFQGPVAPADLVGLYNAASAFLFASRYEGFGLPILEAMACGTPVVTCATTATGEIAGNAALTIPTPDDLDALADAIGKVLTDQDMAGSISQEGLKRAAEFSWERSAKAHFALYRRLISQSRSSAP
ncbi:glycosyltransferase family 1 protein [Aurantiacibacter sp. MUD11]|uniref:glycosyltransferase family 4 protein n=1 Tax=Aurantiacibacter sp. MUD11 TaxID=3003265 RepID=UPI0022AA160C|nr:glycosyltransferase family 1 protein [Aurantiacibacter sp. MUD11]WAT19304.1 glycosyltransferase family 1 protein [Aurantiacibacter sp. MUD11]